MKRTIPGLHHITAIASDPQRNVDFYTKVLGLRLVKLTINYDDPSSYHLYYGDESGSPGSILTFFAWPAGYKGRHGVGQAQTISFEAPTGSLDFWETRLTGTGIQSERLGARFGENVLSFTDPDGLSLELIEQTQALGRPVWAGGGVPPEAAIRGFHSVTLPEHDTTATIQLLTGTMGFRVAAAEGDRTRLEAASESTERARTIDVLNVPEAGRGAMGVGCIHHVAWRTPDDDQQREWREELLEQQRHVSPVMDRQYFHSIYFSEPGGVLFEIATDPPGFGVDESVEKLGSALRLPAWMEKHREQIEALLPPLRLSEDNLS